MKKLLFLLATASAGASLFAQVGQLPINTTTLKELSAKMWSDPAFQEAFVGSYVPLESLEPEFTNEEKIIIKEELLDLITSSNPLAALPQLEKMAKKSGASAGIDFLIGNLYLQNNRAAQAEHAYLNAVKKFKNYRRAWKNLGLIYATTGELDKALGPISKALELGDVNASNYSILGIIYMQKEDYISAESALRNALMMDPKSKDLKENLFKCMLLQERYKEANALLKPLLDLEPNNKEYWKYQANIYIGLEQPLEAAEVLEIRDRMGGSDAQSLEMLGTIYLNHQLFDVAYDVYQRALKSSGARFSTLYNSANALAAVGNYENAMTLVDQLRKRFSNSIEKEDNLDLLVLEANCLRSMGKQDEAVVILEKIVLEDPMNGRALIELGLYYKNLEVPNYNKAIALFERAENVTEYSAKAYVQHGQMLVVQRKYREAASLLRRAQNLDYKDHIQVYLEKVERAARQF